MVLLPLHNMEIFDMHIVIFLHVIYVFHGLGNLWPFVTHDTHHMQTLEKWKFNISTTDPHSRCDKKMPLKMQIDLNFLLEPFSDNNSLFLCWIWLTLQKVLQDELTTKSDQRTAILCNDVNTVNSQLQPVFILEVEHFWAHFLLNRNCSFVRVVFKSWL